jgi:hypothetical protein
MVEIMPAVGPSSGSGTHMPAIRSGMSPTPGRNPAAQPAIVEDDVFKSNPTRS